MASGLELHDAGGTSRLEQEGHGEGCEVINNIHMKEGLMECRHDVVTEIPVGHDMIGGLSAVVDAVRKAAGELEIYAGAAEGMIREREQLRARCAGLEREHEQLRQSHEALLREHQAAQVGLGQLQTEQAALRQEHEGASRAFRELRDQYQALTQERQKTADELEAIFRRLRP